MGLQRGWIAGTGPFFVSSSAISVAYDQAGFRGRNDDGNETTATWKAAENTGWSQAVDENFRFRAVIDETAGGILNAVLDFKLQYNLNGAGWNDVNTTSLVVRTFTSPNVTNGEATTRQLTSGSGAFVAGSIDENNGAAGTASTIDSGELTEIEWVVQLRSVDVADNDTIQLRAVETVGSIPFAAYTQVPTVTVSEPGAVIQVFVLDDELVRRIPRGEFEHQISFWEVNQPAAPPAPDGVASFGLGDWIARPVLGGEFFEVVSFWEQNQPAPGAPPDGVANFGLDDRIHRPYVPAESAFWWEKPTEVQTVPLGAWFPLPDELVRLVPQGNGESWVSFFEVTQPPPAVPELSWQGLRDELIRPVPRGEWDAVWYPLVPPVLAADIPQVEGKGTLPVTEGTAVLIDAEGKATLIEQEGKAELVVTG